MSNVEKLDVHFGESGEESLQSYRSINRTSVVGLGLGVLSAFSLLHWLLLPIAVAATVVCAVALRQIASRSGEFVGRKAALAGIALAVFFFGFVVTREVTRRHNVDRQARQHADQWFRLLQEGSLPNLYQAFELKKRYHHRELEGTDLAPIYGDPAQFNSDDMLAADEELMDEYMPRQNFHSFLEQALVKQIIALGGNSKLNFERVAGRNRKSDYDVVILEYSLHDLTASDESSSRLYIKMARDYFPDKREGHWYVVSLAKKLDDT